MIRLILKALGVINSGQVLIVTLSVCARLSHHLPDRLLDHLSELPQDCTDLRKEKLAHGRLFVTKTDCDCFCFSKGYTKKTEPVEFSLCSLSIKVM